MASYSICTAQPAYSAARVHTHTHTCHRDKPGCVHGVCISHFATPTYAPARRQPAAAQQRGGASRDAFRRHLAARAGLGKTGKVGKTSQSLRIQSWPYLRPLPRTALDPHPPRGKESSITLRGSLERTQYQSAGRARRLIPRSGSGAAGGRRLEPGTRNCPATRFCCARHHRGTTGAPQGHHRRGTGTGGWRGCEWAARRRLQRRPGSARRQ